MTPTTVTGHLSWDTELREGPTGQHWLILGLVVESDSPLGIGCGLIAGAHCDVICHGSLAREVHGLRAGTVVEVDVDGPRTRTWVSRDGDIRRGIRCRGLAVRVVERPSLSTVVRRILATKPAEDVLR